MIIQAIIDMAVSLLCGLFDNVNMPDLPFELLEPIGDIVGVGMWVIGKDLFLMMIGSFMFWITLKLTLGIILWAYNLIAQIT